MNLDADLTPEELKVFLTEVNEHIELMDEDIVKLEKEGDDPELLQEIFRAAHTIKGSSAMVGFQVMAELTHSMESLLDKLRNKNLQVTTDIIDALLFGLDILKSLVGCINSSDDDMPDIQTAVNKLKSVADGDSKTTQTATKPLTIELSQLEEIQNRLGEGEHILKVDITISKDSDWPAVRCMQIFNELPGMGEIITSSPKEDEIEEDSKNLQLSIVLLSSANQETIQKKLLNIGDIQTVEIQPYTPEEQAASAVVLQESGNPENTTNNTSSGATKSDVVKKKESVKQDSSQSVRVDVEVLDSLLNVVEELVIDRSKISQVGKMLEIKYPGDELITELASTSDHIIKTINELQEYIMQARMIPIGTIFNRFPRMVRDLAQSQNKKLDFIVEGAETELDRTIIEQIRDPLTHLLRNGVDHGVESAEDRKAAGKSETATIRLSAYREQSHIVITVEDDGKGINPEKVKQSAIKKGLISEAKAENLSEAEAINLIFMAGMSTKEQATEVSGRGVGMDIVRANVESLGGTTTIETKEGKGSKFIIKLPLTVAIVQGFLISVGEAIYILPMGSIAETVSIGKNQIQTIRGREIIRWRESLIPLVRLNKVFNNQSDESEENDQHLIVIVTADNCLIGLVIDELLEPQEIVVKSLGNYLGEVEGIAGATILGDGRVALILDVSSLIKMVLTAGSNYLSVVSGR